MSLIQILGLLGAACVVGAYAALQAGRWQSEQRRYSLANALGAALILVSLVEEPNWPSIAIEGFWLLISLAGLWKGLRR